MNNQWQKISSKIVYQNPWIRVHEDQVIKPDGSKGIYGYMDRIHEGAITIPLTKDQEVYLIYQYRYPIKKAYWSFPHGDSEEGESELEAAKRELLEETGLIGQNWQRIGEFFIDPGTNSQRTGIYVVQELEKRDQKLDSGETGMQVKKFPLDQIDKMVDNQEIIDGWALSAIYFLKRYLTS